jgi:hypothetical protein
MAAAASCLATLLALSAGCGSSIYAEKMKNRLDELKQVSAFAALYKEPTDDLPVNFRMPLSITRAFDLFSVDPVESSKHVARDRVLPPFLQDGVGFRRTFEGAYEPNPSSSIPYFIYIWEFDAPRPKDGLEKLRDIIRFKLHDEKANWEPVEVKTPEGTTITWQRLHIKAEQTFETKRNGLVNDDSFPGVFELWAFETPGWDVLLGWRASDDAWDKAMSGDTKLGDLPAIVAGTIRFAPDQQRNNKPVPKNGPGLFAPSPVGAAPVPDAQSPPKTDATPPNNTQADAATDGNQPANDAASQQAVTEADNVLKRFLTAMVTHDEAELRVTATADPELAVLLQGQPIPAAAIEGAKNAVNGGKFRHLKVGDEVKLPGGEKIVLDETQVNADRQQIEWNNAPIPFILVKGRDGWKVNPAPLIAAGKAAAAVAPQNDAGPAAPAELQADSVSGAVQGYRFSLKLPVGWKLGEPTNNPNQARATAVPNSQKPGGGIDESIWMGIGISKFNPSESPEQYIESQVENVKRSFFDNPQLVDAGTLSIQGNKGPFKVVSGVQKRTGEKMVWGFYVARIRDDQVSIWLVNFPADRFESMKTVFKESAESFQLDQSGPSPTPIQRDGRGGRRPPPPDGVAGAPNAAKPADSAPPAAATAPANEGPAEIEFSEGVTGSITFPAGFQHDGKAPQASTAPPMQDDPAAAAQQPNTIKIDVKKLGQGTNYIDLLKQTLSSEIQGAADGKSLERGNCTIAGVTGDYIVVGVAAGGIPGGREAQPAGKKAERKRIVYIANVTPKHVAVKITAEMDDANYKTLKEAMKKCVRSLKFD